jgi:hypothetical protein
MDVPTSGPLRDKSSSPLSSGNQSDSPLNIRSSMSESEKEQIERENRKRRIRRTKRTVREQQQKQQPAESMDEPTVGPVIRHNFLPK